MRYKNHCIAFFLLFIMGCSGQDFNVKQLAKSDIDMVSDMVLLEINQSLKQLMYKLYKRNPDQLALVPQMTVNQRVAMIFETPGRIVSDELQSKQEIAAMSLAFDEEYKGDRVFALMVGLTSMIRLSYNYDDDFFIYEDLNAQALYNSARNIEVMAWKLKNKRDHTNRPFLISSSHNGIIDNTSFDRLYGKLIQTQDLMSKIIADRDNRTINTVIKGTLSVFLPI